MCGGGGGEAGEVVVRVVVALGVGWPVVEDAVAMSGPARVLCGTSLPRRSTGGPDPTLRDGRSYRDDTVGHTIDVDVAPGELDPGAASGRFRSPCTRAACAKYARLAQGAERGAITEA